MPEKPNEKFCEICGWPHPTEQHARIIEEDIQSKNRIPEIVLEAEQRGPSTLDIVRVDGRWGQVFSPQVGAKDEAHIRWLDDLSHGSMDMANYDLKTYVDMESRALRDRFSETEFNNIHWEAGADPFLKGKVTVFGEYVSKKSS